jgi:transposase
VIRELGYTGSRAHLERLLTRWRPRSAGQDRTRIEPARLSRPTISADPVGWHLLSPITAATLCIKPRALLTERQATKVDAMKDTWPDFAAMRQLAMRFHGIMRSGDLDKLTLWINDGRHCGLHAMQRFARSLQQDIEAVRNAMAEPWSNGQAEGQINRLKTLKRSMYGRAGVELLRARLIPLHQLNLHTC